MKAIQLQEIELLMNKETHRETLSTPLNERQITLLHFAVHHSDEAVVKLLFEKSNIDVSQNLDVDELNIIHYASKDARHLKLLQGLLKTYPSLINSQCKNKKTPLHYAVHNNCYRTIELILAQIKVDVTITDTEQKSILHYIISKKSKAKNFKEIVKKILRHNSFDISTLISRPEGGKPNMIDYAVGKECMIVLLEIGKRKSIKI